MKKTILFTVLALSSIFAFGQDFPFGRPATQEFDLKRYDRDTSATAVVLREYGTAWVSSVDANIVFEYHVRTKIFNSKGFSHGNIEIPLIKTDANTFEKIRDIKAVTFYPDENGLMRKAELDPKQIFTEKRAGKYTDVTKFAMPSLRDGCIIEYSYIIESPYRYHFRTWEFQSDIPKIYSEFNPRIPGMYNYNITLVGPYKLSKNTGELEKECFSPGGGFKADCSKMFYAMEHVPAFIEEDYMTAASNFKAAMKFELSQYTDFYGQKHRISKEWKDVDRELKADEEFGGQVKKKGFFEDKMSVVTAGKVTELDKAKSIYSHMQKWFKWNNTYGIVTENGIKKAYDNHTGNVGDINLGLTAAMNSAGINAEPVILSTRDNGNVSTLFPVIGDFNYVVCKVNIGQESFLLDATDPLLPFGLLPIRCMNDKGRVMSTDKPSDWIDLRASEKEYQVINMDLSADEAGKIKGTMVIRSSGYEAYNKRRAIKKFNSGEEFVDDLDEHLPRVKILKSDIANIDSLDKPVIETYEIEINYTDRDLVYLNPFFINRVNENPFKLFERSYPVDWGAPSETRVAMQLQIPEKFDFFKKPENTALALPNNGGRLVSQTNIEGNRCTLLFNVQLNKSIYSSEEYAYIKELYNKIIKTQETDIILKKKL